MLKTWIDYESDNYRVWGHSTGDRNVENTASGESRYFQGDDADKLADDLCALEDDYSDEDPERVEFMDHYLSQYFGG